MKTFFASLFLLLFSAALATAQSSTVTLEGQLTCSVCWYEADRTKVPFGTAADLECEVDCASQKIPAALALKSSAADGYTLYVLEDGKFKKEGKNWLAYMANQVRITGTLRTRGNKQYLKVDALEVLSRPKVETNATPEPVSAEAELVLKDLLGLEQKLSSHRGRIVVLNFWATWCVPCRKEMPDLAKIQNKYAALGVQVIGAAIDTLEDRAKVSAFIKETNVNFPVWLGATTTDMRRLGVGVTLPRTLIIDRDGKIAARIMGVVKEADLRKRIDSLIATPPTAEKTAATSTGESTEAAPVTSESSDVSTVPS